MRIEAEEAWLLKETVRTHIPEAKVYLFGSRADDAKRGGDIDVLVIGPRELTMHEKADIRYVFWKKFGEQKIDIASFSHDEQTPFRAVAEAHAVLL